MDVPEGRTTQVEDRENGSNHRGKGKELSTGNNDEDEDEGLIATEKLTRVDTAVRSISGESGMLSFNLRGTTTFPCLICAFSSPYVSHGDAQSVGDQNR